MGLSAMIDENRAHRGHEQRFPRAGGQKSSELDMVQVVDKGFGDAGERFRQPRRGGAGLWRLIFSASSDALLMMPQSI